MRRCVAKCITPRIDSSQPLASPSRGVLSGSGGRDGWEWDVAPITSEPCESDKKLIRGGMATQCFCLPNFSFFLIRGLLDPRIGQEEGWTRIGRRSPARWTSNRVSQPDSYRFPSAFLFHTPATAVSQRCRVLLRLQVSANSLRRHSHAWGRAVGRESKVVREL